MKDILLIRPRCAELEKTKRLSAILQNALEGYTYDQISIADDWSDNDLQNRKILFAISLGASGINLEYYKFLKKIRLNAHCLEGSVAGLIVDSQSELFSKSVARELAYSANMAGCAFIGRPLVEGTASLTNYNVLAKNMATDNLGAYVQSGQLLTKQLMTYQPCRPTTPHILVIHASNFQTSNTLKLWRIVKKYLVGCQISEISIRNGTIMDCSGCPYKMCLHFSAHNDCFYGGAIVEDVYPAILACNALILLCPNYNDAVSANIAAMINRLTALFRKTRFYDKVLYSLIVSGYSGGDIVAQQLISALNMNKSFALPPYFALLETANDPDSIGQLPGIEERAAAYAKQILTYFQ